MRWWHRLRRHARQIAGMVLLLVGLMLMLSWAQRDDPDCYVEQDWFVQKRLCLDSESEETARRSANPLLGLIVGLGAFAAGAYLLASGHTARPPDDADSE